MSHTLVRSLLLAIILSIVCLAVTQNVQADSAEIHAAHVRTAPPPICPAPEPVALLAGDSWAQYMWDDNSHNDIFDRFGHADKQMLSQSLDSDPGAGYTGSEYAISGSEARQWNNPASYPWVANLTAAINDNPSVETVVLSIGGNDVLAGKSDGGWYKDMDLDVAGSEAALFDTIADNSLAVVEAITTTQPSVDVLLSSYDYPNFNVSFLTCWVYACPKRRDLSRDPSNDLITDSELNGMMVSLEDERLGWANDAARLHYDNAVGLMHHYYGDGVTGPGMLPKPGTTPPSYAPFPGGNPQQPTLRNNFRLAAGFDGDPIHLDFDGYQYKIAHQTEAYFFPKFRGDPSMTFESQGGQNDGWTDGTNIGSAEIRVGEDTSDNRYYGLISIDTSDLPDSALITSASLYLQRDGGNDSSPFQTGNMGTPILAVKRGTFGDPQVERLDATTVPTANDVGCFYGSAKDDHYAVRVDLVGNGLTAINKQGLTQFRIVFPNTDSGLFSDPRVDFLDGDSSPARGSDRIVEREKTIQVQMPDGTIAEETITVRAIEHQGIADAIGSTKPFLDVTYTIPTAVATGNQTTAIHIAPLGILTLLLIVFTAQLLRGANFPARKPTQS